MAKNNETRPQDLSLLTSIRKMTAVSNNGLYEKTSLLHIFSLYDLLAKLEYVHDYIAAVTFEVYSKREEELNNLLNNN